MLKWAFSNCDSRTIVNNIYPKLSYLNHFKIYYTNELFTIMNKEQNCIRKY